MIRLSHKAKWTIRVMLFTFILQISTVSCNKSLDLNSTRQQNEAGSWNSFEDARAGLMGLYGLLRAAMAENNGHWIWGELRQGDFTSTYKPDLKAIIDNNLNASYPLIQSLTNCRRFYATINACNLFIESVGNCLKDLRYTESYYKLDVAQARSIRALTYFYMVRIWGDVPFITKSNDGGDFQSVARTNQRVILDYVEKELLEASAKLPYLYSGADPEQLFPSNYYGQNQSTWLNSPISRLAAYAILAHVAAWQGKYVDVATYSDFIINNAAKANLSSLPISYLVDDFFNGEASGNYDQLLALKFGKIDGESTTDGHIESLTLANTPSYFMSKEVPDIYVTKAKISEIFTANDPYDQRFGTDTSTKARLYFTNYFENYTAQIPVFKKIRIVDGQNLSTGKFAVFNSSIVFTRYEEIRLLRAEANAALGLNAAAIDDINTVRSNRGTATLSVNTPNINVVDEVFKERRRELMGEGWRWYDLVRYNKLKGTNTAFMQLISSGGIYWPIAQDVLANNPLLVQNSYWK